MNNNADNYNEEKVQGIETEQNAENAYKEENVSIWRTGWRKELIDWVVAIGVAVVIALVLRTFVMTLAVVDGASMENTLHHGDRLYVNKLFYTPEKGDIVIVDSEKHPKGALVKRVIATEGQTLQIDFTSGKVRVNGKVLNETYIREPMRLQGDADIPNIIPEGYSFVMGDNRNHSMDSRFKDVGLIDNSNIVGKATLILYPFSRFGVIK